MQKRKQVQCIYKHKTCESIRWLHIRSILVTYAKNSFDRKKWGKKKWHWTTQRFFLLFRYPPGMFSQLFICVYTKHRISIGSKTTHLTASEFTFEYVYNTVYFSSWLIIDVILSSQTIEHAHDFRCHEVWIWQTLNAKFIQ